MARGTFSNSNYLLLAAAPAAVVPLTMSCWLRPTNNSSWQTLIHLNNPSSGNARNTFTLARDSNGQVTIELGGPSSALGATAPGTTTTNTWNHAGAVFTSNASRRAFLNGAGGSVETSSLTPSGVGRMSIGAKNNNGTVQDPANVTSLAEVAIWNAALSEEEMALLGKGIAPELIRPQALVSYVPLIRDLIDLKSSAWTAIGSPAVVNHPRVLQAA